MAQKFLNGIVSEGDITTDKKVIAGSGDGSVALTVNDGGGNANLTFNHASETPDKSGNSFRIRANVDSSTSPVMLFEMKAGVTAGTSVSTIERFRIDNTGVKVRNSSSGILDLQRDDTSVIGANALGKLRFMADDPTNGSFNIGAEIKAKAEAAWDTDSYPSRLEFYTTTTDTSTLALTIDKDQNAIFEGQVIFPSAATTKPVLPNGFISRNDLDDTSGRHDIWGISERYYPSNSTAGDAWGIQWSGTPNDIVFVGGGTDRFTVSLDEGNITSTGSATFAGNVDVTRSSTGEVLSRIWNSNTGGNGTAVMRIANSGNQANGARLEFSDHNYYNATVSVDRTNGMRFMVHDNSTSMSDLLTHTALTLATNKNATFGGDVKGATFNSIENAASGGFPTSKDYLLAGTGARGGGLIINDISGARHGITAGGYDLTFSKETDNGSGTLGQDIWMRANATDAAGDVTSVDFFKPTNFSGNVTVPSLVATQDIYLNDGYTAANRYLYLRKNTANDGGIVMSSKAGSASPTNDWQIVNSGSTRDLSFYAYGLGANALVLDRETGDATFAGTVTINGAGSGSSGSLNLVSSDSFIRLNSTGGTTDKQKWDVRAVSASGYEALDFRTVNDANNSFSTKLSIAHSGNATFAGAVTGTSFSATGGFLNGSNGGIRIHASGTKFFNVTAANSARDNIMDVGASDARFKDAYFGGTVSANAFTGDGSNLTGITVSNADTVDNLHASAFLQVGGSWNGANMPGSRHAGIAVNGGEIVFQRDNPNTSRMSILVDGQYYAGENGGFYSLSSGNSYNNRKGFYADTSGVLQFNAATTFAGDVNTSTVQISSGQSYSENIRMFPHPTNDYSSLILGAVSGTSGTGVGQWSLVRYPTATHSNKFSIRHNSTDAMVITTGGITTFNGIVKSTRFTSTTTSGLHFSNYTGNQGWQIGADSTAAGMYIYNENGVYAMKLTSGGNATFHGSLSVTSYSLIKFQQNGDVDTGTEVIAEVSKSSYTAAFFDYVIKKGTNVRAGVIYACHDGSTGIEYAETSTVDLGDTTDVILSVVISGSNMVLQATTTSDDWSVKSLTRAI